MKEKSSWIVCNAEGCLNLKDGRCSLDGIQVDPKTGGCLSADYPENAGCIRDNGEELPFC